MQLRKVIHISGVLLPVIASVIGKNQTIALLLSGFAVFLIIEALKQRIPRHILSMVYRENEFRDFSIEPSSYFISVILLLYLSFFIDEKICFAAIAILAAGDGFAGVVGRKYGKHRFSFNKNKSWEGTLAGFLAASLSGFYFAGGIALVGGAFGMLAGAVNKNDNIAVPYAALAAMFLVQHAFFT
jgi:dolichol kinase